jgi:hypothetical protein
MQFLNPDAKPYKRGDEPELDKVWDSFIAETKVEGSERLNPDGTVEFLIDPRKAFPALDKLAKKDK